MGISEINNIYGCLRIVDVGISRYRKRPYWRCECVCGVIKDIAQDALRRGMVKSCGCMKGAFITKSKIKHGLCDTPIYHSWLSMKARCINPKHIEWDSYGGRGIEVCARWIDSFDNFYEDMGERPEGTTLDRIDNDGNYYKNNCRWATNSIQGYNQRQRSTNTSGRTGVYYQIGKWIAKIGLNNKLLHLGSFNTFEDAVAAREAAELKYYGYVKTNG